MGRWLFAIIVGSTCLPTNAVIGDEQAERAFRALVDDSWQFDLQEDPLFATQAGDHSMNDQLPSVTVADYQRRLETKRDFAKRLNDIDRDKLSRTEQINYDIFRRLLANSITELEFESYLTPITNRWGFHIGFAELGKKVPLGSVGGYRDYIARLRGFEEYADQHIVLLRAGMEKGVTLPAVVMDGYEGTIRPHVVDNPKKSLLYEPFTKFPETFSDRDKELLEKAGRLAIAERVVPGYRKFLAFMKDEYLPACRGSIAASALPRGREIYRYQVHKFTTLDITPEEVHKIGLDEVKRIRAEMIGVIKESGFDGDFPAFVKHLRSDPKFYAETPEELLKEVAYALKRMDGQLPRMFQTLPRTPYGICEVPAYLAPVTTTAYYTLPAGDGSRAGFYYVNTYNLKARPLYEVEALSLHEAVPGHHLQLALQQEIKGLPNFRRFSGFTVFVEGWAMYAERLGSEVGFYQDPYSDFGRLSYEMWRACRLVVDTGVHYLGWTRKQAIDYMAENTSLSVHNIEAEVDRYISWPGQALAYKIGELKIRQLRKTAEAKLGAKFDIREFHEIVLGSGSVPLTVLEDNVRAYIAATE